MTTESDPSPDEAPTEELKPEPKTGGVVIKRRWSVFTRAGSGAMILAATGAIALGSPGERASTGTPGATSAETQERVIE